MEHNGTMPLSSRAHRIKVNAFVVLGFTGLLVLALVIGSLWWGLLTSPPRETYARMPLPEADAVSQEEQDVPVGPEHLLLMEDLDRSGVTPLPEVEEPQPAMDEDFVAVETDFGYDLTLPAWLEQYENRGNQVTFAGQGGYLYVSRIPVADPEWLTLESELETMGARDQFENVNAVGDDSDWTISAVDVSYEEFYLERAIVGPQDYISIYWRSAIDMDGLQEVGHAVVASITPNPSLAQGHPPAPDSPLPEQVSDAAGHFSFPPPPGAQRIARTSSSVEVVLEHNVRVFIWYEEGPLDLETALGNSNADGLTVMASGEDEGHFWYAGSISEFSAFYRHVFHGTGGHVYVSTAYDNNDAPSREVAGADVRAILETLQLAPLE